MPKAAKSYMDGKGRMIGAGDTMPDDYDKPTLEHYKRLGIVAPEETPEQKGEAKAKAKAEAKAAAEAEAKLAAEAEAQAKADAEAAGKSEA